MKFAKLLFFTALAVLAAGGARAHAAVRAVASSQDLAWVVKAIGGKRGDVRMQFLWESVLISLLGAAFGVVLGVIVGNVFSLVLSTGFGVPWVWVIGGIFMCSLVGVLAGLYPAYKAARLNPIEALRYE